MHIIPAVDIKNGKAVRLLQGQRERETVYGDSPLAMALRWQDAGATYLHVVDLDGAFDGESENLPHLEQILRRVKIPVEIGGGIRSLAKARQLCDLGAAQVILGTTALQNRTLLEEIVAALPRRVSVGVDAKDGKVAVKGWTETGDKNAEDFLRELSALPLANIIYTDIARDGALQGVNVEALRRAASISRIPLIASGGVTSPDDIRALAPLPLFGIITGKALYDGRMTLAEATAALAEQLTINN
ncbi:1-(5-phosphoribosyl)-5-[(5-phosphoribosylamino) methylideneamino] imidazole-4-carboxamide isomerase [Planctomycetales bacterium]|nr:1-(5-phosphoribosyl)-5-[(5-phosphoribosylamino) methylideneamino] imidazole-4-carboxamide isomerase [Planctomycetales bacterium]GHT04670.1 1-(5-phosphoribosyl)-5-[(5-phosphoribosylamino) methylideneamino] imidazole-4-carboxamide isomerase [Planctomycetales bacterium]GHV22894.1 1-(5-phosphoribosyl)-5-[(5-phosphoribosylamino) methylideneamino] imidazole-4-carboxamide isomerase [Planctomycetales bacterium]